MVDSKFFSKSKELTLDQVSKLTKITLPKSVDKKKLFNDISGLDTASQDNISFLNKAFVVIPTIKPFGLQAKTPCKLFTTKH